MTNTKIKIPGTKFLAIAFVAMLFALPMQAQRIAYCDITTILESISEYQQAQTELDQVAATWRQEIAQEYDKIKSMYNRYQAEQVLLSDEARRQREDEIMNAEQSVRELQKQRFGPEGDLFQRRRELVQPIQDRVYAAIEDYANDRGYDFIFDRSASTGMIFSNERYDVTNDILERLQE
jgi:outer membrane protein